MNANQHAANARDAANASYVTGNSQCVRKETVATLALRAS